jgi:hypothetical protein
MSHKWNAHPSRPKSLRPPRAQSARKSPPLRAQGTPQMIHHPPTLSMTSAQPAQPAQPAQSAQSAQPAQPDPLSPSIQLVPLEHTSTLYPLAPSTRRGAYNAQVPRAHSQESPLSFMEDAVSMTVSRQHVVYDGQKTYVEAEERRYEEGQWTRTHASGTWEGDRSDEAVRRITQGGRRGRSRR